MKEVKKVVVVVEEEEEEVSAKKWTHEGVMYLKTEDNIIYDIKTQEAIGVWNEKTGKIDMVDEEMEEEDYEEED